MKRTLACFLVLSVFVVGPALAQVATFEGGSIYDLDPLANQSTGNRILEQMLENDDMQPVVSAEPSFGAFL